MFKKKELPEILETSTDCFEGFRITKYLGVTTTEVVIGTGPISEFFGKISDFFGIRSNAFENKLDSGRSDAFKVLREKAVDVGANAIVGIDVDIIAYEKNRTGMMVTGTFVQIEPYQQFKVEQETLSVLSDIKTLLEQGAAMHAKPSEPETPIGTFSAIPTASMNVPSGLDLSQPDLPDELNVTG